MGFLVPHSSVKSIVKRYKWESVTGDTPDEISQSIQKITVDFVIDEGCFNEMTKNYAIENFDVAMITACSIN